MLLYVSFSFWYWAFVRVQRKYRINMEVIFTWVLKLKKCILFSNSSSLLFFTQLVTKTKYSIWDAWFSLEQLQRASFTIQPTICSQKCPTRVNIFVLVLEDAVHSFWYLDCYCQCDSYCQCDYYCECDTYCKCDSD